MCPPAKIMTMSTEPIASGANWPTPGSITVMPMVKTRKNVPMNSTINDRVSLLIHSAAYRTGGCRSSFLASEGKFGATIRQVGAICTVHMVRDAALVLRFARRAWSSPHDAGDRDDRGVVFVGRALLVAEQFATRVVERS
jgi:hypothetical protein